MVYRPRTIPISRVVKIANNGLKNSSVVDKQWRMGIISLLEAILKENNSEMGFDYLDSEYELFGEERRLKDDFDFTRRRYN